jgi:hypothetical protein
MITGYSSNKNGVWNEQFLRSQGVVAVLNKPFNLDLLVATVESTLKERFQHSGTGTETSPDLENGTQDVIATLGAA